jgi:hypothetical protein
VQFSRAETKEWNEGRRKEKKEEKAKLLRIKSG